MKQLLYSHERVLSLAEVAYSWLYRAIVRLVAACLRGVPAGGRCRRYLVAGAVVLTLVIEAVMIYLLAELVDLSISLMELWAELARKHLEITN
jgi:hypothetical protein